MRKLILTTGMLLSTALFLYVYDASENSRHESPQTEVRTIRPPESGPDVQRWFFETWHDPRGAALEPKFLETTLRAIQDLPSEIDLPNPPAIPWQLLGPRGMIVSSGVTYSGRILDIAAPKDDATLRIAAASGGLWQYLDIPFLLRPIPMTNTLNTQAVSTVSARPGDKDTIIIGTGEQWQRGGTGMFMTTDGGANWTQLTLTPQPGTIYRVRYSQSNPEIVHAVTNEGYYRSDDGGTTWDRFHIGNTTDMAIDPVATHLLYLTQWHSVNGGVYQSSDGGTNWSRLANGLPTTNVGRSAISLPRTNSKTIYVSLGRDDDHTLLGIYKSENNGQDWINVSPDLKSIGGNAWYNNVISACPTDANIVLVGMTQLLRTTDGGMNWSIISTSSVHVDHHAITWDDDGNTVWNGNDGGITRSDDQGATWVTAGNSFPITQFYAIDVAKTDPGITYGGAQDNGLIGRTGYDQNWHHRKGGDGAGIAIDPQDATKIYAADGLFSGAVAFQRFKSNNTGITWTTFVIGITGDLTWVPKVRSSNLDAEILYTNGEQFVYTSGPPYTVWQRLNTTPFPAQVTEITVSKDNTVYACLNSFVTGNRLRVYTNGTWQARDNGLPVNNRIRKVVPHSVWPNRAYAIMDGLNTPGAQIFQTSNHGISWTNVTGNLPNLPVADLVTYPHIGQDRILYLGTEFGCFRTTDGGANWHRWNFGMPEANIITEMTYVDSLLISGKFYVVGGTFGRSIWRREVGSDDPTFVESDLQEVPESIALHQNYPNPFNQGTTISYDLNKSAITQLTIYNLRGETIRRLISGVQTTGKHQLAWDGRDDSGRVVSSGVYFYSLKVGESVRTRRMVLLK
ncbi:MAG: T9SS type A sorting domain-containing protein [Calditrichaeota bacterium]|nr:T9SS type A sorting domain-containing protein [Calditrichota bacterium]